MANLTLIQPKQINSGVLFNQLSGWAIDSTAQTLASASGYLNTFIINSSGNNDTKINNLSGYCNTSFSSIQISGGTALTGVVTFTGVSGLRAVQSGNIAIFSTDRITTGISTSGSNAIIGLANFSGTSGLRAVLSNPNNLAFMLDGTLSGLTCTGSSSVGGLVTLSGNSGVRVVLSNPTNFVYNLDGTTLTGIGITGSTTIVGLVNYTGYGGLVVLKSGQTIIFSGAATSAGGVGNVTGVGIENAPILFTGGFIFSGKSGIVLQSGNAVNNNWGIQIAQTAVSGLSFNSSTSQTGLVNINSASGLTILQSSNTFTFGQQAVSGIQIAGGSSLTGLIIFSGSGATLAVDGNIIAISGGQVGATGPAGPAGAPSNAFFGINFFLDFPYTGLNVSESTVSSNIAYTGYTISCVQSGVGPEIAGHYAPMTGKIYTISTGNTKYILTQFTFDSGEIFQQSGGANVTITGWNRLGFDITRSLSGLQGMTISIFGSGI